jgi:hypothetical protein
MSNRVARNYRIESQSAYSAWQKVKEHGLPVPKSPDHEMPDLPDDVTELSDSSLMKLFRRLMAYQKFLGTQLALAEADEKYFARKMSRLEKGYDFRKAADKEASANDTALKEAEEFSLTSTAYRRLVDAIHAGVEADTFICSRELTRRLGTADRDSRSNRWTT